MSIPLVDALAQVDALASLMREPAFEADLWKAQNIFYELMTAISALNPSELSVEWLSHFVALATSLGIAIPEAFPASRVSQGNAMPPQGSFLYLHEAQKTAAGDFGA